MLFSFQDYIFDSDRLIIYNISGSKEFIDILKSKYDTHDKNNSVLNELLSNNSENMCMDKIAINSAGICLTFNCNLRCDYCSNSSGGNDTNILTVEDVQIYIKDIIKKSIINRLLNKNKEIEPLDIYFTGGGEPTFRWDLFRESVLFIKEECTKNNIPLFLGLTTNGVLNDEQIGFISDNIDHIMISYDGLPEIQNKNRKSANQQCTNEIVENTIKRLSDKKISMNVRTTVWEDDYFKLRRMYDHVFSLVGDNPNAKWSVYPTFYEGRALENLKNHGKTNKSFLYYYISLLDYIILEKGKDKLNTVEVPLYNNEISEIFCGEYRCNNPWLLPDKSIVTCIESCKGNQTVIGKINEGKVEYYHKYNDKLLEIIQQKFVECRECIAYNFCKGGCPIWELRNINKDSELPECMAQKEYWTYVIEAMLLGKYSFGWRLQKICVQNYEQYEAYKLVFDE